MLLRLRQGQMQGFLGLKVGRGGGLVVYMLNCVFWRHILLEIEFKSRVDMGSVAIGILHSGSPI